MTASQAAIHTTSMQLTNTIYNLAGRPEYLKPLREEIEEVLAGEPDGILTRNGMSKLKKLDSFMYVNDLCPLPLTPEASESWFACRTLRYQWTDSWALQERSTAPKPAIVRELLPQSP